MNLDRTFPRRTLLARLSHLGLAGLFGQALALGRSSAAFGAKPGHAAAKQAGARATRDPMASVTANQFSPFIGETFRVFGGQGQFVDVTLVSVTPIQHPTLGKPVALPRPPFSLVFTGPVQGRFPQDTYLVRHRALGSFNLFLVPIGAPQAAPRYEAVFG